MTPLELMLLGSVAGAGAGLLAGLVGIGGGIVVVPVVYHTLISSGLSGNEAAHVAVATSLAAIMPAAIVSSVAHWRAGNTDIAFLRDWGPGIAIGVIAAQLAAPYLRGAVLTGAFAVFCLVVAARFAAPGRLKPRFEQQPNTRFCHLAGLGIGLVSGFAGVGGGILTNVAMALTGMPMHRSIGRAAAAGVAVGLPATIVAALGPISHQSGQLGSINLPIWACIAPAQAAAAWIGARLAQRIGAENLSRLFAAALLVTGVAMLRSSLASP